MEMGLVVLWLAAYLGLLLLGLPVAAALIPDRGAAAGVAVPLALATVGLVAYWIGHLAFGYVALGAGLVVLGVATGVALARGHGLRGRAVETAVVFALAFAFLVALRAMDPAVHPGGGEKFLDFGMLKALLRAPRLPPEDFWFAGEPVTYYYGGHMLAALLAELTGTPGRYAYNLALSGYYATFVTAAYGLAGAVGRRLGARRRTAAGLGAFFVGFASNLMPAGRLLVGALPGGLRRAVAGAIAERTAYTTEEALRELTQFSYWSASRIVEGAINEFPLFAWLNGDLHAHMMSPGFLLLAAALCFAYFRTPDERRWRRRGLVALVAAVGGLVAVVNTWSFASVYGILWLALLFAPADPATLLSARFPRARSLVGRELRRAGTALVVAAVAGGAGVAMVAPFWLRAASGRSVAFLPERSSMAALVLVHGAFLAVTVAHLLSRARPLVSTRALAGAVAASLAVGIVAWAHGAAAVGLFGPVLAGAWLLGCARRHERDRADRERPRTRAGDGTDGPSFATVLVVGALGLVVLVEFVYVRESPDADRYNTVFKTYAQVWALWATASGAMLARLAERGPTLSLSAAPFRRAERATARAVPVGLGQVVTAALVVSLSVYGGLAVVNHVGTYEDEPFCVFPEEATLDALAFVDDCHPGEASAIAWIDSLGGTPTVAAAPGQNPYGWQTPASSLTGVPAVVGSVHETGYRGRVAYDRRAEDVRRLYEGDDATRVRMLRRYDVAYVYVGPRERDRYGANVSRSFERLAGVSVATSPADVTIFRVDPATLPAGNATAVATGPRRQSR
jgi:YYY domain-containing protein